MLSEYISNVNRILQLYRRERSNRKFNITLSFFFFPRVQDLVKSHLMFAVREEVEVLKEKIAELMDRINQLELENTILKSNATQETLLQLAAAAAVVTASGGGSGGAGAVVGSAPGAASQLQAQQQSQTGKTPLPPPTAAVNNPANGPIS